MQCWRRYDSEHGRCFTGMPGYKITVQIRWSLLILAQYPRIQEELFEESLRSVGRNNRPGPDNLKAMPKFEAFMSEVIRYVVPLGVGLQHETSCSVKIDKYTIPEGTPVVANIYSFRKYCR